MSATIIDLTNRDRSVLRAVAAGRCAMATGTLTVDGVYCSDQFAGVRLAQAGLVCCAQGAVSLTDSGLAALRAAA